jgi:hypothetical protein
LHIGGSGPDDVWAIGGDGLSLHYDGHKWTPVETGSKAILWSLWSGKNKETWLAGNGGTLLRWNGSAWATP